MYYNSQIINIDNINEKYLEDNNHSCAIKYDNIMDLHKKTINNIHYDITIEFGKLNNKSFKKFRIVSYNILSRMKSIYVHSNKLSYFMFEDIVIFAELNNNDIKIIFILQPFLKVIDRDIKNIFISNNKLFLSSSIKTTIYNSSFQFGYNLDFEIYCACNYPLLIGIFNGEKIYFDDQSNIIVDSGNFIKWVDKSDNKLLEIVSDKISIIKKISFEKIKNECVICFNEITTRIVLNCGHSQFHEECVKKTNNCPLCRILITDVIKLYE